MFQIVDGIIIGEGAGIKGRTGDWSDLVEDWVSNPVSIVDILSLEVSIAWLDMRE